MTIVNSYNDLNNFYIKHSTLDIDKQVIAFCNDFLSLYETYYEELLFKKKPSEFKQKLVKEFLIEFPKYKEEAFGKMRKFETMVKWVKDAYSKILPDADFSNILILSIPSLFTFDAMATEIAGNFGMVFAFDTFSKLGNANDFRFNYNVLMAHEFGHIYHVSKLNMDKIDFKKTKLTLRIWFEGIALYLSRILCPEASLSEIYMNSQINTNCLKNEKSIITNFAKDAESLRFGPEEEKWFMPTCANDDIPERSGYFLGLKVVEAIAKEYNINEFITWDIDKIHNEVIKRVIT